MCLKYTDTYHPLSILSTAVLFQDGDENGALKKKKREKHSWVLKGQETQWSKESPILNHFPITQDEG